MRDHLLYPFGDNECMENRIFEGPYRLLREMFCSRGAELRTVDLGHLETADLVLFFNHNSKLLRRCHNAGMGCDKLVLFLFEPRVVFPEQYSTDVWDNYGKVFTSSDHLVIEGGFLKMLYPQARRPLQEFPGFHHRLFVILINTNKFSEVPGELYSCRRKAIRYFKERTNDFDLYGYGWNQRSYFLVNLRSRLRSAILEQRIGLFLTNWLDSLR